MAIVTDPITGLPHCSACVALDEGELCEHHRAQVQNALATIALFHSEREASTGGGAFRVRGMMRAGFLQNRRPEPVPA